MKTCRQHGAARRTETGRGAWARLVPVVVCAAAIFATAAAARAQQGYEVRGTVADSAGQVMENAMVVALTRADSVLVKYSLTNRDGHFRIKGLPPANTSCR